MKPPLYLCMAACCFVMISCSMQQEPKPFCRNGHVDSERCQAPVYPFPQIHLIKPPTDIYKTVSFGPLGTMPKLYYRHRRNTRKGSIRYKGEINPFKSKPKGKQF